MGKREKPGRDAAALREGVSPATPNQADGNSKRSGAETPERRIVVALRRIVHATRLHSRQLAAERQVTGPQLVCLQVLSEEGSLTSRRLAQHVHLDPSTMVGIVDRLESKGFLLRERSSRDRRAVLLNLTEAGAALVKQAPSPLQALLAGKLRRLSIEERRQLAENVERIVRLMEADDVPPTPIMELPRYERSRQVR